MLEKFTWKKYGKILIAGYIIAGLPFLGVLILVTSVLYNSSEQMLIADVTRGGLALVMVLASILGILFCTSQILFINMLRKQVKT